MGTTTQLIQYNATPPVLSDGEQRCIRSDFAGRTIITQEKRATYSASITDLAVVSGATDFFTITGSTTKTIIIKRVLFSANAQATTQADVQILRRSTANSGGASTLVTPALHDTTNDAATATVRAYTSNPTLGTLAGLIRSLDYTLVARNSNSVTDILEFIFGIEEDQGIVLRGTSEVMAINHNGDSINSCQSHVSVEWREVTG